MSGYIIPQVPASSHILVTELILSTRLKDGFYTYGRNWHAIKFWQYFAMSAITRSSTTVSTVYEHVSIKKDVVVLKMDF